MKPKGRGDYARLKKNIGILESKEHQEVTKQSKAEHTYIDSMKEKVEKEEKIRELEYVS